ncbi:MAG: FAD:protein FMN transferase [Saprospiraceae bacterium]|nr:FAD:protein FMN transferase [Saprospiraceae bacterium]
MNELPSKSRIDTALPSVGFDKIRVEGTTITIPDGCWLNFGAIAKGFAVDEAVVSSGQRVFSYDGGWWGRSLCGRCPDRI